MRRGGGAVGAAALPVALFLLSAIGPWSACHGQQWKNDPNRRYPDPVTPDFLPRNRAPPGPTLYRADLRPSGLYERTDDFQRYSDARCSIRPTSTPTMYRTAKTPIGVFTGRIVYLCDLPEFTRTDQRPVAQGGIDHWNDRLEYPSSAVAYLGIPYAQPPLGHNRFKEPQAHGPLGNVQALNFRDSCIQHIDYKGQHMGVPSTSEDCLYLNIYTPNLADVNRNFAVMVHIHGGEFDHGSGNLFPGHMLAASQEVVVVTFNYRLGALGFLATGDGASPGNYGLLDQAAAIQWVRDYIAGFSGDPSRITLFGPGAGAASAGLHLVHQMSRRNLAFQRVIAAGGSPVAEWALDQDPIRMRNMSWLYSEKVGCYGDSTWRLLDCLRSKGNSSSEFTLATVEPTVGRLPWGPVLDRHTRSDSIVSVFPEDYLRDLAPEEAHLFSSQVAYMTGVTRDEASYIVKQDRELKSNRYVMTPDTFQMYLKRYARQFNYSLNEEAAISALSFMYTPWSDQDNQTLLMRGYVDMLSDSYFVAPHDKVMKLLLNKGFRVYAYVVNYTLESYPRLQYGRRIYDWDGIPQSMVDLMVSGAPFMDPKFYPDNLELNDVLWSEGDRNMSQLFMQAWANFAKTGDPMGGTSLFGSIRWDPATRGLLQYLCINGTYYEALNSSSFMLRDYRQKESQFWNAYLPELALRPAPTWPPWDEPLLRENRLVTASLWGVTAFACLLLILTVVACCCYCKAASRHLVDEDDIPHASMHSLTESTSSIRRMEFKNKYASPEDQGELRSLKNTSV
ncbi:cholinesterase isoform X1 [Dermacentor andersoni]|uniref:cholinesterase isoform X1 n=1 Tax=Dermacentor andersoni TaxID=34620 RepID=UPI002155778E|nr:cholinesterase-like isoform X1 [Dermacentor andersoni]